MLLTNNPRAPEQSVKRHFENLLDTAQDVTIACGYFGQDTIETYKPALIQKVKAGGEVRLINGLGAWEGVAGQQEQRLRELDRALIHYSATSGVFYCTKQRYHGKIYTFKSGHGERYIVGSSNYSPSGHGTNLEANLRGEAPDILADIEDYIAGMMAHAARPSQIQLPQRGKSKQSLTKIKATPALKFAVPMDITSRPPDFEIPIRYQPKSNLNLTFGAGRVNRATGIYTPRPYYEVELTIPKRLWRSPLTDHIPDTRTQLPYDAVTDNGMYFDIKFSPKTSGASLRESGGDFMSSPRELLGEYIKGKLMTAGVLKFGDPITPQTLHDYGTHSLKVRMLPGGRRMHLEF